MFQPIQDESASHVDDHESMDHDRTRSAIKAEDQRSRGRIASLNRRK